MNNQVLVIQQDDIKRLQIPVAECIEWVKESFKMKYDSQLPPKISVHPQENDFFTSMPCYLPGRYATFGIKVVHRIKGAVPSLGSDILLYDSKKGRLLAFIDGNWITTMRTGAVATLAIKTLKKRTCNTYSFIGLGNTARATALCLLESSINEKIHFRLLKYKNQTELFKQRFSNYSNVTFETVNTVQELIAFGEVIISCITDAKELICSDNNLYQPGTLLIPIHTRGFQNCDLFFDKIFGDDTGHIEQFKYFNQFKRYDEFSNVLNGKCLGRGSDLERIISYNIGLGLHDVFFAYNIFKRMKNKSLAYFTQYKDSEKFWI